MVKIFLRFYEKSFILVHLRSLFIWRLSSTMVKNPMTFYQISFILVFSVWRNFLRLFTGNCFIFCGNIVKYYSLFHKFWPQYHTFNIYIYIWCLRFWRNSTKMLAQIGGHEKRILLFGVLNYRKKNQGFLDGCGYSAEPVPLNNS